MRRQNTKSKPEYLQLIVKFYSKSNITLQQNNLSFKTITRWASMTILLAVMAINLNAQNIIKNGSFENGLENWTMPCIGDKSQDVYELIADSYNNLNALMIKKKSSKVEDIIHITQPKFKLKEKTFYNLSYAYKLDNENNSPEMPIMSARISFIRKNSSRASDDTVWIRPQGRSNNQWHVTEENFFTPPGTEYGIVDIFFGGTGAFSISDIKLCEKENIDTAKTIAIGGNTFLNIPRNKEPDPRTFRPEKQNDLIVFKREPRMAYFDSYPQQEEIIDKVKDFCTPGEIKGIYFTFYAQNECENLSISADEDLSNQSNQKIDKDSIEIKKVTIWPQRIGVLSYTYHEIPELLENFEKLNIPKNNCQTFWIRLKVPDYAEKGLYKTELRVNYNQKKTITIPFELTVLPFKLHQPDDIDWVLYFDPPKNSSSYSCEKKYRYIKDMKEYGMTSLMMWNLAKEWAPFIKKCGLCKNILCVSPGIIDDAMREKYGLAKKIDFSDPGTLEKVTKIFKEYQEDIKNELNCKELYFYIADEPHCDSRRMKTAKALGKALKTANLKTTVSCYPYNPLQELAPYIDANINNLFASSDFLNKEYKALAKKYDFKSFFLGGGCYLEQEGGLMPDRYLAGFLFYKSGASAHVSWTYRHIHSPGDAYNDFASSGLEGKKYYITYPAHELSKRDVSISTLQWEGIREGVIDYKYLDTLKNEVEKTKNEGANDKADTAKTIFMDVLNNIPWRDEYKCGDYYLSPGNFSNLKAEKLRWMIANEILKLKTGKGICDFEQEQMRIKQEEDALRDKSK